MSRPSYAQIQQTLRSPEIEALPAYRISVLRNVVVEPIEPLLRYLAYRIGFNATCTFGAYDNVFQEAAGTHPTLLKDTDCVLVFLKLEQLSWDIARNFAALTPEDLEREKDRLQTFVEATISGIRKQTRAQILWSSFEFPVFPSLGIADMHCAHGQIDVINGLNRFTHEVLRRYDNAYAFDVNACLARIGATRFYDSRYWHLGKAPYSREGLEELSGEIFKYVRAANGRYKKCLVLDCDNVLWGGVVGEEGIADIRLGKTHPGSAYYEFQQELVNLYHRGVVLALCSKNNQEDVWQVFDEHPEMPLKRHHIAAARINWDDKVRNLKLLASDLNLTLDSFVFADDSLFEISQVRELLPQVEVLHLPEHQAVDFRSLLLSSGWFDTLHFSAEDRQRGAMYHAEANRNAEKASFEPGDLEAFLLSLQMELQVRPADEFSIPRIAQLTQKTNQFNLTTKRYSMAQIRELADDPATDVLSMQLRDRFGDSGITGVCILRYEQDAVIIDSFLLSCRVLGRSVEDAFLLQCLRRAAGRGATAALATYQPTSKNQQVMDFYPRFKFRQLDNGKREHSYALDLTQFDIEEPRFFARIEFVDASSTNQKELKDQ